MFMLALNLLGLSDMGNGANFWLLLSGGLGPSVTNGAVRFFLKN
jgi:hypothetical protein